MLLRASIIAAAAGLAALVSAAEADAAPVTYVFTVTATSGPQSGVIGEGAVTFDGPLNSVGLQTFTPGAGTGGLTISFTTSLFGAPQTFTQTDDDFYAPGAQPVLQFLNGAPVGLNFVVTAATGGAAGFGFASDILSLDALSITTSFDAGTAFGYFRPGNGGEFGRGVLALQPVPVPGALALLATGLAGLAAAGRRKRRTVSQS